VADFDVYSDSYRASVEQSIAFCGQELEYFTKRKVEHLLELTGRHRGDPAELTFLDVGCGVGVTDAMLCDRVGELHGVDVAADAVARAAERNPRVHYRTYDGSTLPYEDGRFDVAFAICVAHHVSPARRKRFAAEIARVVKKGGLVAVFEHNPYNPLTRVAVHRCEFDEDAVLLTRRVSAAMLRDGGLTPIDARYIIFLPFGRRVVPRLEGGLGWLPLGAQHYVVARR
jgi:SAM-dependent methyltransferase